MTDIPDRTRRLIRDREAGECMICRRPMTDIHHRQRKGMGGSTSATIHDPSNLIGVCRFHHGWIHAHPETATAGGWIVPTTVDPLTARVWMQSQNYAFPGWFELGDDGFVVWAGDDGEPAAGDAVRSGYPGSRAAVTVVLTLT